MKTPIRYLTFAAVAVLAGCCIGGCKLSSGRSDSRLNKLYEISEKIKHEQAPDRRTEVYMAVFEKDTTAKNTYVLRGETTVAQAKQDLLDAVGQTGIVLKDSMRLLPDAALQGRIYGLTALSVINFRYGPDYDTESATQTLMGTPLRILDKRDGWTRAMTPEGYIAYVTDKSVAAFDKEEFDAYLQAPKLMVTAHYTLLRERPSPKAPVAGDAVWGNIVRQVGERMAYYRVLLPNGKTAYLSKFDAEPFNRWLVECRPQPENIIATAKQFTGFPYLWAGTSVKAMDCSGFTKTVYYLNGLILLRDASQQAETGDEVDISAGLENLQPGDLIFFGRKAAPDRKERVSHVGIYLGDKEFIHSATYVRINSLDPESPLYYEGSPRLLRARRIVGRQDCGKGIVSIGKHPWYVAD